MGTLYICTWDWQLAEWSRIPEISLKQQDVILSMVSSNYNTKNFPLLFNDVYILGGVMDHCTNLEPGWLKEQHNCRTAASIVIHYCACTCWLSLCQLCFCSFQSSQVTSGLFLPLGWSSIGPPATSSHHNNVNALTVATLPVSISSSSI